MNFRSCPLCFHHQSFLVLKVEEFNLIKCRHCRFVFLANPPQPEDEARNYDDYFKTAELAEYKPDSPDANIRQAWVINEQRLAWVRQMSSGRLLDIGCGRGYFLQHARQNGFEVEGVEISRLAAKYASETFSLTVHICSLDNEITFDGQYDVITMWHVLEHFYHPLTVLENVWTLLRPGGRLYVELPNWHSLKFQLSPAKRKWRGGNHPRYHRSFFTRDSLFRLLDDAAFSNKHAAHLVYKTGQSAPVYFLKKILNAAHRDSFLDVMAIK